MYIYLPLLGGCYVYWLPIYRIAGKIVRFNVRDFRDLTKFAKFFFVNFLHPSYNYMQMS